MNTASAAENCRERLALLGTDYDTLRAAEPPVIAAALEKLVLLDLARAMADQSLSPEIRDKAATDLLKWQRLNLARARLTFDKAKFEAAQKLAAEKNQPPFEASLEQQAYIMDKIDYMLGIPVKTRNPPGPVPQASLPAVPPTSQSAPPTLGTDTLPPVPGSTPPPRFPDPYPVPQASLPAVPPTSQSAPPAPGTDTFPRVPNISPPDQ